MQPDFDKAQEFTRQLGSNLNDWTSQTHETRSAVDFIFLNSLFHHNWEQPYIRNELGDLSYQFIWPEVGEIHPTIPAIALDEIIFYYSGAQLTKGDGNVMFSLTPGDMLGLKLFNSRTLDWRGDWAEPVNVEEYVGGGAMESGIPNEVMLPPLVARSLHYAMSLFANEAGFEPRITLLRPTHRTKASEPSDLLINCPLFPANEQKTQVARFINVVCRHAPEHIARRILVSPSPLTDEDAYVPLKSLFQEPRLVDGRLEH